MLRLPTSTSHDEEEKVLEFIFIDGSGLKLAAGLPHSDTQEEEKKRKKRKKDPTRRFQPRYGERGRPQERQLESSRDKWILRHPQLLNMRPGIPFPDERENAARACRRNRNGASA